MDRRFAREQVASWLGLSPVPERSPGGFGNNGFNNSAIDHNLTGRSPPLELPTVRIVEPSGATSRSHASSMVRGQSIPSTPIVTPVDLEMSPSRPQPFRFLSMIGSSSKPPSEASSSRAPSIHPNIAASRRAMTGARTQSVSAATALMVMNPKAAGTKMSSSVSTSGLNGILHGGVNSPPTRDRRKSEDWGGRMKAPIAAAVLETTPSLGQPTSMNSSSSSNRKSLEMLAPITDRARGQEIRIQEAEVEEVWGRLISGTNVRVGEVSSKSGKGEFGKQGPRRRCSGVLC